MFSMRQCGTMWWSQADHRWQYGAYTGMLGNQGYRLTLRIRNAYCFSTATVVMRTGPTVMFIHALPVFFVLCLMTGADASCQCWWWTAFILLYSITGLGFMRMFHISFLVLLCQRSISNLLNLGSIWKWLVGFTSCLLCLQYLLGCGWVGSIASLDALPDVSEIELNFFSFAAHTQSHTDWHQLLDEHNVKEFFSVKMLYRVFKSCHFCTVCSIWGI